MSRPSPWPPRRWPEGVRASLPLALPTLALGVSFGLLAAPVIGGFPSIAMSALVWAGTAQFAAISILASGGNVAMALGAGLLANTRFLPMGFAVAPSMDGGWLRRMLIGVTVADGSFVVAHRTGAHFDVSVMAWAAPVQYLSWSIGTIIGVLGADWIGDPARWGLDVIFPVFYLSLLLPELRSRHGAQSASAVQRDRILRVRRPVLAAALAGAIAIALTPVAPPGTPLLAASAAALIGLVPPRPSSTQPPGATP